MLYSRICNAYFLTSDVNGYASLKVSWAKARFNG